MEGLAAAAIGRNLKEGRSSVELVGDGMLGPAAEVSRVRMGWVCPKAQRQNSSLVHGPCLDGKETLTCEVMPMNMLVEVKEATSSLKPMKVSLLRRIFNFLVRVLSSPKGDQGGWEGGARGL